MTPSYSLSVAPMMARTTRHCRVFHRIVAPQALLYTEMIAANALRFGDARRLLEFSDVEHPVALQLGGDDASTLGWCSGLAEDAGYDEVNLNVGCPSPRVQKGSFGACLMKRPQEVARMVETMRASAAIPVTVKCRIGVDEFDDYEFLESFTKSLFDAGVERVIVHARMAYLKGLSPKENRTVPPLRYDRVQRLASDFPSMTIIVNGGINSLQAARDIRSWGDGIMIGRAALEHPALLAAIHDDTFGTQSAFDPIKTYSATIFLTLKMSCPEAHDCRYSFVICFRCSMECRAPATIDDTFQSTHTAKMPGLILCRRRYAVLRKPDL